MTGIFDFLDSLDPNLGAVYSCNGLVLLTDKEYSFRLEQIRKLQQKVNQLETNRDEAIELLSKGITFCENDSQSDYDICNIAINREKKVKEILERSKD